MTLNSAQSGSDGFLTLHNYIIRAEGKKTKTMCKHINVEEAFTSCILPTSMSEEHHVRLSFVSVSFLFLFIVFRTPSVWDELKCLEVLCKERQTKLFELLDACDQTEAHSTLKKLNKHAQNCEHNRDSSIFGFDSMR
jgi:hypothetical protein